MPSLAVMGARMQTAMVRLETALAEHAAHLGLEAPALPTSKHAEVQQAARLEAIAEFLEQANSTLAERAENAGPAPEPEPDTEPEPPAHGRKGKRT